MSAIERYKKPFGDRSKTLRLVLDKHRSDIFRLAATLPDVPGPDLPTPVREDLEQFLAAFPESSHEWRRILSAFKAIFGVGLRPERLLAAVRTYFRIPNNS